MSTVTFQQIILRGCGLDVHRDVVVATICGEGLQTEPGGYKTFISPLTELKEWLLSKGITHVAMESTGVYWKPVNKVLECPRMKVWIVNARHIKYVPGHKTDKKDSAWICKLLLAGLLRPSYIPEREQRELRDLTRYRNKLIQHMASEKNRIVRILEDCNIKLSSVMSHLDGAVGTKLIDLLVEKGHVTMDDIPKDIRQTETIVTDLTDRIKEVLSPYQNVLELLKKIPGLSSKTVEDLIAEIGLDMEVFPTEKHLASWAGVCLGNNENVGKKKFSNQPRKQTGKSCNNRSRLGGYPYQTYILQCTLSPISCPKRQEKSVNSRRTFDPQIGMACVEEYLSVQRTRCGLSESKNREQTKKLP